MQEKGQDAGEGISINGKSLNNIGYADDTTSLADSHEGLQHLVRRIAITSSKYGLDMNIKKTKLMIISKNNILRSSSLMTE